MKKKKNKDKDKDKDKDKNKQKRTKKMILSNGPCTPEYDPRATANTSHKLRDKNTIQGMLIGTKYHFPADAVLCRLGTALPSSTLTAAVAHTSSLPIANPNLLLFTYPNLPQAHLQTTPHLPCDSLKA